MISFDAVTGAAITDQAHLLQSIRDILTTPIGSRVMRRDYGSALFALVDAPIHGARVVDIIQATAGALGRWEPRVAVETVRVEAVADGHLDLTLAVRWKATGAALTLGVVL